jgi:hypothetical protein
MLLRATFGSKRVQKLLGDSSGSHRINECSRGGAPSRSTSPLAVRMLGGAPDCFYPGTSGAEDGPFSPIQLVDDDAPGPKTDGVTVL